MTDPELKAAIETHYGFSRKSNLDRALNAAIRTLPGGLELLSAIETTNASRNHAMRAGAKDRLVPLDTALDKLEDIREAMCLHIIAQVTDK